MGAGGRLGGKSMVKELEDGGEEHDDGDRAAVVANMVLCWWTEGLGWQMKNATRRLRWHQRW